MCRISKIARWYFAAFALGFVLALLGVLQYRANRQLRDVLQQEMLTDAQTSLMRIRHGLEDELRPICNTFSPARPSSHQSNLQHYAAESLRVRGTEAHPGLVTGIFVFQNANRPHPKLFQIADSQEKFHPAEWPANLSILHNYLVRLAPAFSPLDSRTAEEEAAEGDQVKPTSFPWF